MIKKRFANKTNLFLPFSKVNVLNYNLYNLLYEYKTPNVRIHLNAKGVFNNFCYDLSCINTCMFYEVVDMALLPIVHIFAMPYQCKSHTYNKEQVGIRTGEQSSVYLNMLNKEKIKIAFKSLDHGWQLTMGYNYRKMSLHLDNFNIKEQ